MVEPVDPNVQREPSREGPFEPFIRQTIYPGTVQGDAETPTEAVLQYYPGRPTSIAQRLRIDIRLRVARRPYLATPWYAEVRRGEQPFPNFDRLYLYVDRDVEVHFPETPMEIPDPEHPGVKLGYWLESSHGRTVQNLLVRVIRAQHPGGIPQSPYEAARPDQWSETWETGSGYGARIVKARTTERSGLVVQLERIGRHRIYTSQDQGAGGTLWTGDYGTHREVLARLRLRVWNPKHPGAYALKVVPGSPMAVSLAFTGNYRADIEVSGFGTDAAALFDQVARYISRQLSSGAGTSQSSDVGALAGRCQSIASDWDIDLKLKRPQSFENVARPGAAFGTAGDAWFTEQNISSVLQGRVRALSNSGQGMAIDLLQAGVSFIPIVGDLIDLGELVHSLSTGRDLQGRDVDGVDLAIMGLALLPGLPSGARHLRRSVDASRAALRRAGHNLSTLRAQLMTRRPRWARAMARAGGGAQADRLLEELLNEALRNSVVANNELRSGALLTAITSSRPR